MRAPSTSMKRPSGGTAFSTCRAVRAEKTTSPPMTRASNRSATPTIQATVIIGLSHAPDCAPAPRQRMRICSFLEPPAEKTPVSDRHQPLDDRGPLGVGADQNARLAVFDAANDRFAGDLRRHSEEGVERLPLRHKPATRNRL